MTRATIALLLLCAPGMAAASSFYIGVTGGITAYRDTTFNIGDNDETRVISDYRQGETASLVFGRASEGSDTFRGRMELEVGRQSAEVRSHTFDDTEQADLDDDTELEDENGDGNGNGEQEEGERVTVSRVSGETSATFGFLSGYGDFRIASRLDAVLGFGIGLGKVTFEDYGAISRGRIMDDDGLAYGYHVMAGLAWRMTSYLDLEASYRQRSWESVRLRAEDGTSSRVRVPSHNMQLGLRLRF